VRLLLPLLLLAFLVAAPAASAVEVLGIEDPVTDNYKASYNADPSETELRTWLSIKSIHAAGTTWAPAPPSETLTPAGGTVSVNAADGRTGTLTYRYDSGPVDSMLVRIDPLDAESHGKWGPLMSITSRSALQSAPVLFTLSLVSGGATIGTGSVSYRHDASVANAPSSNIEYNGPGGRWYVGSTATRLNWESGDSTTPTAGTPAATVVRPRITRIILPSSTSSRFVRMRVMGRAGTSRISHLRVRIGNRSYGRWVKTGRGYTVVLPKVTGTLLVRVQLRDASGRTSALASRRIRCSCS